MIRNDSDLICISKMKTRIPYNVYICFNLNFVRCVLTCTHNVFFFFFTKYSSIFHRCIGSVIFLTCARRLTSTSVIKSVIRLFMVHVHDLVNDSTKLTRERAKTERQTGDKSALNARFMRLRQHHRYERSP